MSFNFNVTEKQFKYINISLFVAVFIFVINTPIVLANDSEGYLDMAIYRSAVYPIFLNITQYLFGSYFPVAAIILHFGLGAFSICFLIKTLKKYYSLNNLWYIILTIILFIPYVYNHKVANVFLSEALAYPLYLICVSLFIASFLSKNKKQLLVSIPILIVLLLTRSQFLFLIPIALIILLFISFNNRKLSNKWLFLVFLVLPLITSVLDKTYHKIVHDKFISTPWTGIHIITPAFYVSDIEDYSIYNSEKEQEFFKDVYSKLYTKQLNVNNLSEEKNASDEIATYIKNFPEIANHTILVSGKKFSQSDLTDDEKIIAVDILTKQMTTPLILDNFKKWCTLNIKNFINAFGNAKYALLFIILLLFSFYQVINKESKGYKIIFLLLLLTICNIALISIGMHTLKRYTFYNDWVLFLVIFILFNFSQTSKKKSL